MDFNLAIFEDDLRTIVNIDSGPGCVDGVNRVAEWCARRYGALRLDRVIRRMAREPADPDVRIELTGGITRPPMVPNERSEELIRAINRIGKTHGLDLSWSFSGVGSDASFACAFGAATRCGLGPVGGEYHTSREDLQTCDLRERMCVFRDSVESICNGKI